MIMETHYYLLNNTVKKGGEMPVEPKHKKDLGYEHYLYDMNDWEESLQPCEISESELEKIMNYTLLNGEKGTIYKDGVLIDITDIIEDNNGVITFKQPKQVESECEAVEFLIEQSFKLGVQWGETYGGWFNPNKEDNERKLKECKETVKQLYQIFKNR